MPIPFQRKRLTTSAEWSSIPVMPRQKVTFIPGRPLIVGSFGSPATIPVTSAAEAAAACDVVEIRLDILAASGMRLSRELWAHLTCLPLLFTARRKDEGSPVDLSAAERSELLRIAMEDASIIDIEVASIDEMQDIIGDLKLHEIPWVASYHDFENLPSGKTLGDAAAKAKLAGASVFKAAARLHETIDISRLAEFQRADHNLPVATMGMGPFAPVSRLLCAQCGSALNYGYIGDTPTAPGQWSSIFLKQAIDGLTIG
jgi:3-dehydroquinate dehydratase-1